MSKNRTFKIFTIILVVVLLTINFTSCTSKQPVTPVGSDTDNIETNSIPDYMLSNGSDIIEFNEPINNKRASQIAVNQIGYLRKDPAKFAYVDGGEEGTFSIVSVDSGEVVYEGSLKRIGDDLTTYNVADFTDFEEPGTYYIIVDGIKSYEFVVGDNIYAKATTKALMYFTQQRQGDTYLNIEGHPTFLDDGIRSDTGEHVDVVGGWNDANDYRRWTFPLGYALMALPMAQDAGDFTTDSLDFNELGTNGISDFLDEARWGAEYFLKMQDPRRGYIWPYCGGDNTFYITDNIIGTSDDREILVERGNGGNIHTSLFVQYEAAAGIAALSIQYYDIDREYSERLKKAAERVWDYTYDREVVESISDRTGLSFKALCSINMYRMALKHSYSEEDGRIYRNEAINTINTILQLQENNFYGNQNIAKGWFYSTSGRSTTDPNFEVMSGGLPLLVLAEAYRVFGEDIPESKKWQKAAIMYIENYIKPFADNNPFGYTAIDVLKVKPLEGFTRQYYDSDIHYRYFARVEEGKSNGRGNNGGLLGNAAAMLSAVDSGILGSRHDLKDYSMKQASRIIHLVHGANPQNLSHMRGIGVQTPHFIHARGRLEIQGAIIKGALGDNNDEPYIHEGYHSLEYWAPYNSFYLLTMAYLKKLGGQNEEANTKPSAPFITGAYGDGKGLLVEFEGSHCAEYYKILYGTESGNYQGEAYSNVSPARADGLDTGKTYYVQMVAVGPYGESEASNEVKVEVDGQLTMIDNMNGLYKCYSSTGLEGREYDVTVKSSIANIIYNAYGPISSASITVRGLSSNSSVTIDAVTGDAGIYKGLGEMERVDKGDTTIFSFKELPLNTKYVRINLSNSEGAKIRQVRVRARKAGMEKWWQTPNIAVNANISASSTVSAQHYDVNHLNDGIMMISWLTTWTNDTSKGLPAWVELDFAKPVDFRRVEILTLHDHPIGSYILQYWNGEGWTDLIVKVEGNINVTRYHEFDPVKASKLRIVGYKGSQSYPQAIFLCGIIVKN